MGDLHAPGRGLPHDRVRRAPARPRRSSKRSSWTTSTSAAPHNVEIIFGRRIRRDTTGIFRTAIDRPRRHRGVVVNVFYKHSRIKQYLKDGRAMRIETVVNAPRDLGCNARLPNLDELQAKARACNRRILMLNVSARAASSRVQPLSGSRTPPWTRTGGRTPALRFGDPRVMALVGALCPPCSPPPASPTRACVP